MLLNIRIAGTNGLVTKLYSTVNIAVSSLLPKWSISKLINHCTRYIKMPHLRQLNMLQKNKENWKIGFSHKIQMKSTCFVICTTMEPRYNDMPRKQITLLYLEFSKSFASRFRSQVVGFGSRQAFSRSLCHRKHENFQLALCAGEKF